MDAPQAETAKVIDSQPDTRFDRLFVRNMLESFLRIGIVLILLNMAYDVIHPFVVPLLWGGIVAIAAFPLVKMVEGWLGGRRGLASGLVTLSFILLLVVPSFLLTESLLGGMKNLSTQIEAGTLDIPPPKASVADWPLIGEKVHASWSQASENLEQTLVKVGPQLKELSANLLKKIGSGVMSMVMFVIALLIAGGFMGYAESTGGAAHRFFVRLAGETPGGEWATLVVATVRSVLLGVVGVAVIQASLCALGLFVAGIPGAPIWSAIILFFAIAQLPAMLVAAPIIVWGFGNLDSTTATIFAVWMVLASLSDNILKPLLMGRGLDIPMPVILIGAIGGMVSAGIIGLFAGAVVLSILYKLFIAWLEQDSQ